MVLKAMGLKDTRVRWHNGRPVILGDFWEQRNSALLEWLERAKRQHRLLAKRLHPDRKGSHRKMAELNALWRRARFLFGRRGIALN
jgi:hypothetical protein